MRKQNEQVVETTITKGVSVIRAAGRPRKSIKVPEKRKLRVAAYCRVSKDIEEQESSIETQMETYDRLISQHPDWELVEIYADKGKTGTSTKKRVAFQKMLRDAKDGKIDKILVKSISRFCRNTLDMLNTIRELRDLGVGVVFEKENLDTTSIESELLLTVYAAFAQEESFSISENMRGGIRQRFKLGIPKVSQVYGYDNLERGVLSINEEKAAVVREIYQMYIDGNSTTEIADYLNDMHELPPVESGKSWYPTSVKCILRNEKYVGDSLMQKYYTANHLEHDSTPNKDLVVEQYYKEGTHPAIVSRDVYEDANLVLMMRDCKRGASQYPYYGRLICPHCGKPMVKVKTGRGKMVFSFLAAVTQEESKSISQNIRWTYEKLAEKGIRHLGNNRVLGYDEIDGVLTPNKDAWAIQFIFEEYAKGKSIRKIAGELEEQGFKTLRGCDKLSVSVIEGILRNEIYKGDRQIQKAPHVDLLTHRPEPGAEYKTYYLEADHEGIVSRELWEKVQEILATPKTTRSNKNSHILKGKVICGDCGKPYVRNSRRNAKGEYKTWDCKGRKGGGECRNVILKEDRLLELIENKIGSSDEASCAGIEQILVFRDGRIEIRMRDKQ